MEPFKIFIGWSKQPSRDVAAALRGWVKRFFPFGVDVFMSEEDVDKGERSIPAIIKYLREADAGIFVITPETASSEWINSEAGAIIGNWKNKNEQNIDNLVNVFLLGMKSTDDAFREKIKGLIKGCQAVDSDEDGQIKGMVESINKRLYQSLPAEKFENRFNAEYPSLKTELDEIQKGNKPKNKKPADVILAQCEQDILWIIYEKGSVDNRYFASPSDISALISPDKYLHAEIGRAFIALEAAEYIKKTTSGAPGYYLTESGILLMDELLKQAFKNGFFQRIS